MELNLRESDVVVIRTRKIRAYSLLFEDMKKSKPERPAIHIRLAFASLYENQNFACSFFNRCSPEVFTVPRGSSEPMAGALLACANL